MTGDWVSLRALEFEAILGVLDWEQHTPQRVIVDVDLALGLAAAGEADDLEASVDYARVAEQLTFLVQQGRFRLLESIALAACRLLLATPVRCEGRARIDEVRIRLQKPDVMGGCPVPGIHMSRQRPMAMADVSSSAGVVHELLIHTPRSSAWRVTLDPEARWSPEEEQTHLIVGGHAADEHGEVVAGDAGAVLLVVSGART